MTQDPARTPSVWRFFLLRHPSSERNGVQVYYAVESLASLTGKRFMYGGGSERRPQAWTHPWSSLSGERVHLDELLEYPMAWLSIGAYNQSTAERIRRAIAASLPLVDYAEALALAAKDRQDAAAVRNLGVWLGMMDKQEEDQPAIDLLKQALQSPEQAIRRAVAEAIMIRKPHGFAEMLWRAAASELDPSLAAFFRLAASK